MNINKLLITRNIFKYNDYNAIYRNEEELIEIASDFFMNNMFKTIHIYKRISGEYTATIKICMFVDELGEQDLVLICDKDYINVIKSVLRDFHFEYKKPNGGKNKKVLK